MVRDAAKLAGHRKLHLLSTQRVNGVAEHLARPPGHVRWERIDADALPAALLERTGVGVDEAVSRSDVEKIAVAHPGEDTFRDPPVLTDLRRKLHQPERFASADLEVVSLMKAATELIHRKLAPDTEAEISDGSRSAEEHDRYHDHPEQALDHPSIVLRERQARAGAKVAYSALP